jgi:phosphoribosyl-AMP cyclohydrolase
MPNQTNQINSQNISQLKFNSQGLIPTIVQNESNQEVVMFAWMSQESLIQTLNTGLATYFSRSRQNLWVKGDTSGCYQNIVSVTADCDFDCLLLIVKQQGPACHTGKNSCFFNKLL